MKRSLIKSTSLTLFALMFIGCTSPVTPNNNGKNVSSSTDNKTVEQKQTITFMLTQKEGGIENPIGPEDIKSISFGGEEIQSSKIGFSTKGLLDDVNLVGPGMYQLTLDLTVDLPDVQVKQKSSKLPLISVNTNSNINIVTPVITVTPLTGLVPNVPNLFASGNVIRTTLDLDNNTVTGGIAKSDGTIDKTKTVYQISGGKITVTQPSGKQEVYAVKDFKGNALENPERTVELSTEELKKQVEDISIKVSPTSPIADYAGLWVYEGFGQKIVAALKDGGNSKFLASATVSGKQYSGTGNYNPTGKNDNLTLKVPDDQMHIEVALKGKNALTLTLKSTSNANIKTFENVPVSLQRLKVGDKTPEEINKDILGTVKAPAPVLPTNTTPTPTTGGSSNTNVVVGTGSTSSNTVVTGGSSNTNVIGSGSGTNVIGSGTNDVIIAGGGAIGPTLTVGSGSRGSTLSGSGTILGDCNYPGTTVKIPGCFPIVAGTLNPGN